MRLKLYRSAEISDRKDEIGKEACWADLQSGARVVWTADDLPVRQIAPRSRLPVGRYNSRKAGRLLHHQSRGHGRVGGEKLALMKCEIDPSVVDFRSQHIRFDLLIGGAMQSYFPDIVRLMHDGRISVIEVKKDARWDRDTDYKLKVETAASVCGDLGWDFDVWIESDMAPTTRVRDNIAEIQMERFASIDPSQKMIASHALAAGGGRVAAADIVKALGSPPGAMSIVRGMMCHGLLTLPLDQRIEMTTIATAFVRCSTPMLEHAS